MGRPSRTETESWNFLSHHAHVLVCIYHDAEVRLRDIASWVGLTERAVQKIVADLEAAGYLDRERSGRRNHYILHKDVPLRHRLESGNTVGDLLDSLDQPNLEH